MYLQVCDKAKRHDVSTSARFLVFYRLQRLIQFFERIISFQECLGATGTLGKRNHRPSCLSWMLVQDFLKHSAIEHAALLVFFTARTVPMEHVSIIEPYVW
jgi:hypothetical protein